VPHPFDPSASFGVFDRYTPFTDLAALKAFSSRPLRKSIRLNALKSSVEKVQRWADEHGWLLSPVPWCAEGFFIDREDRSEALGKDLLHLLGHVYLQEAASMLPAALLDAQPGEAILDMAAAPGSKTTQIAAALAPTLDLSPGTREGRRGGGAARGVIVANDVQEKRLWTLKSAIHRLGVTNVIVTKKVGQWFSKHMTERFDRVLCDAPCTAQGTVRKDSDALRFCGPENIAKMARLQTELLEAAIHAVKVGGRIVYSTCTLTPEENEGVVHSMLKKFEGRMEVVDPRGHLHHGTWNMETAIEDSQRVQAWLNKAMSSPLSALRSPLIRLWPQTYDTEGFFCAVLQKTASTRSVERMHWVDPQETPLKISVQEEILMQLHARYGVRFVADGEQLVARENQILLTTGECLEFGLPVQDYALGLPFGKGIKDGRVRLTSEFVTLRGAMATTSVFSLSDGELQELLAGQDIECPEDLAGDVILLWQQIPIGWGLAQGGWLKNRLSRWVVGHRTS
jgi:16S rRNA (cytosine1407-C5)-methyltransferase